MVGREILDWKLGYRRDEKQQRTVAPPQVADDGHAQHVFLNIPIQINLKTAVTQLPPSEFVAPKAAAVV